MLLSIIIPVYNVEQYIRSCLESVYLQEISENDYEVILVNDGTKDNSFGIIEDVITAHDNIIIKEQTNQGLSAARNTGMEVASGQYILFLDSDDLLFPDTLGTVLHEATVNDADIVIADFKKMTNNEIASHALVSPKKYCKSIKTGKEAFLQDLNPRQCYVWRTLYKKAFLVKNGLCFIPGLYFEDVPFTVECYLKAKTCIKISKLFYIYRQRENSIVSSIDIKKLCDLNEVIARLWEMRKNMQLSEGTEDKLMDTIFTTFSVSIWYITHDKELLKQRKVYVADLFQRVPDLHFTHGIRQKVISTCFTLYPNTYIRIRAFKQ